METMQKTKNNNKQTIDNNLTIGEFPKTQMKKECKNIKNSTNDSPYGQNGVLVETKWRKNIQ